MYQTRFSNTNYSRPISALEKSKYRISSRGPYLWNNYLSNNEKHNTNLQTFKSNLKSKILNCENEKYFFLGILYYVLETFSTSFIFFS